MQSDIYFFVIVNFKNNKLINEKCEITENLISPNYFFSKFFNFFSIGKARKKQTISKNKRKLEEKSLKEIHLTG